MALFVRNKKRSVNTINKEFGNPVIIDVTSKSADKFLPLSPFYPHGDIPVPFSDGYHSKSVEGIWQGLKVFKSHDIDISKFEIDSMRGLKRTARKFGQPIGHRQGVNGTELLDYLTARKKIYLPAYEWVLQNKTGDLIKELKRLSGNEQVILLDYETNDNLHDLTKPLSHAALIKHFIENDFSFNF
jgi:hypothetical protein